MGSFIKNLKSLFIVEEDQPKANPTADKSKSKDQPRELEQPNIEIPVEAAPGEINKKFLEILLNSLQESNQQGFDYLEYKQSLKSLRKMNMDEQTQYKSAFAMAQTMGATPDSLVKTAMIYLDILKKEEEKFKQSLINQRKAKVEERKATLANYDNWVASKEAEIEKIREQIKKKIATKSKLEEEIKKANTKIQTVQNNFMTTYNHLVDQINHDLEKIKRYLK